MSKLNLLTRYRESTLICIVLCVIVTTLQSFFLCPKEEIWKLWVNLCLALLFSYGIKDTLNRHRLGYGKANFAIGIGTVFISAAANISEIYLPQSLFGLQFIVAAGAVGIIKLALMTWQDRSAPFIYLSVGVIIGALSTLLPVVLLWLVFLPLLLYYMRCFSGRNFWNIIFGVIISLWSTYVLIMLFGGVSQADKWILTLPDGFSFTTPVFSEFPLPVLYTLIGLTFLIPTYSLAGFLLNIGESIHAHCSISCFALFSLLAPLMFFADNTHTGMYITWAFVFLSSLISIYIANKNSWIAEWWTTLLMLLLIGIEILPIWIPL